MALFLRCTIGTVKFYRFISIWIFFLAIYNFKSQNWMHTLKKIHALVKMGVSKKWNKGHWSSHSIASFQNRQGNSQWCRSLIWQSSGGPVECPSCWRFGLMARATGSFLAMTRVEINHLISLCQALCWLCLHASSHNNSVQ